MIFFTLWQEPPTLISHLGIVIIKLGSLSQIGHFDSMSLGRNIIYLRRALISSFSAAST